MKGPLYIQSFMYAHTSILEISFYSQTLFSTDALTGLFAKYNRQSVTDSQTFLNEMVISFNSWSAHSV